MATRSKKITAGVAVMPIPSNIDQVPSVYVNNFQVLAAGNFDVRIAFSEISTEDGGKTMTALRKANLVMSTQHFIAMVNLLNAQASAIVAEQKTQNAEAAQPGKA